MVGGVIWQVIGNSFDRDDILHLFAIYENKVWHVKEQMPHSGKFTEAESVSFIHS